MALKVIKMIGKKIRDKVRKYVPLRGTLSDIQNQLSSQFYQMTARIDHLQEILGRIEERQLSELNSQRLQDFEFQVYSQWGEDGIIQYLIKEIGIESETFIEIGAENYTECNTKFLLINNNWSGLVVDGNEEQINEIKRNNKIYRQYDLKVVNAFVTKENINELLEENGFRGEIGLLSIDIDGNDYWIWDAIMVIEPVIVVIEYNHRFGAERSVVVPYEPDFVRSQKHHSMIYFGASLKALEFLGRRKGYSFVGCCSSGVNAFFVRNDKKTDHIKALSTAAGYQKGKFCEYRDPDGNLTKMSPDAEVALLNSLNLPLEQVDFHD